MNTLTKTNLFSGAIGKSSVLALLCSSAALYGQDAAVAPVTFETPEQAALTPPPVEEAGVGSAYSLSLSLDFNSHFISYGSDVWAGGSKWKRLIANPSIALTVDIADNFYGFAGLWMDVNSYASGSNIGGSVKVQEVDVWLGVGYNWNDFNLEVTYQEWMYGGDSERIVDVALSYDWIISPHVIIHNRVDPNGTQKRGTVFVLGASYSMEFEGLEITIPVDVGLATKHYHGGDGGFAYVTTGINLSYPLSFISEAYGHWNVHGGIAYYYTDNSVIPNNPSDSFVTGTFGIGLDF